MKLFVTYKQNPMAHITAESGRPAQVIIIDPRFEHWSKIILAGELTVMKDRVSQLRHQMSLVKVTFNEANYGLAIKQYLERHGFEVIIDQPELDTALEIAVQSLPETTPGKAETLRELPQLTVLEKTALLERLKSQK